MYSIIQEAFRLGLGSMLNNSSQDRLGKKAGINQVITNLDAPAGCASSSHARVTPVLPHRSAERPHAHLST